MMHDVNVFNEPVVISEAKHRRPFFLSRFFENMRRFEARLRQAEDQLTRM